MDNSFQNLIKDWPHLVVYFDSKVHICNFGNKLNIKNTENYFLKKKSNRKDINTNVRHKLRAKWKL